MDPKEKKPGNKKAPEVGALILFNFNNRVWSIPTTSNPFSSL